jgi:hypothetical protein
MPDPDHIEEAIPQALMAVDLPALGARQRDKVCDICWVNGQRLRAAADGISAIDCVPTGCQRQRIEEADRDAGGHCSDVPFA